MSRRFRSPGCPLVMLLVLVVLSAGQTGSSRANDLELLPYNNPGLVVDLGVGLWAWPLPMDYDKDGDLDLVVSCPDKPSNGTYFFENPDGNVPFPTFLPGKKIGPGHHNIRVSHVNGEPRVLIPGIEFHNFRENGFESPQPLVTPKDTLTHNRKVRANQWQIVDLTGRGSDDLVIGIGNWLDYGWDDAWDANGKWKNGPLHGNVFVVSRGAGYRGTAPAADQPIALTAGGQDIDVYGWPSPCFADFDGDDDLDLICGEFLDRFTYFENTGSKTSPVFAAGQFLKLGDGLLKMDLQMIVPCAIDWDGDGDSDLICGDEDGRVAFIEHTGEMRDGQPVFRAPRYFQQQADTLKCGALATPYAIDWDGDGDEDILSGNTAGYVAFFENLDLPDGAETPRWAAPVNLQAGGETIRIQAGPNGSIQGPCEAKWGYTTFTVADWDHDGLLDIVLNSIWGEVLWYRNCGTPGAPQLAAAERVQVEWPGEPPRPEWTWWRPRDRQLVTQWRTTPVVVDMTGDGVNDLLMLDHEGYLALFERQKSEDGLKLLPGRRSFVDVRGEPVRLNGGRAGKSGRRKLHAIDWDDDGDLDLLVNSTNADLLENTGTEEGETLLLMRGPVAERLLSGHTSSPATIRFSQAGPRGLLIGAEDGRMYWMPRIATAAQRRVD